MDAAHPDPEKLTIRCPGCGQRFKVGPDLMERMVECGTCEHRFRVNDELVVRVKKHYPGEKKGMKEAKGMTLDGFSRMPKVAALPDSGFQAIKYAKEPDKRMIEPASPLRPIWGFMALVIALVVVLLLVFGGSPGGVLYGASQSKRLILAGFTAVVCGFLLLAANPRARGKAVLGALGLAFLLHALPFVFTDGTSTAGPVVGERPESPRDAEEAAVMPRDTELEQLKKTIGYAPLERELKQSPKSAGIWLRGLEEYHKLQVRDYIVRSTGASPSSHMYPRSPDYLLVISGSEAGLDGLARLCERFGEVRRTIDSLRIIEVEVNNTSFLEGPLEKLTDPADPAFYELNRRELESIDLERARRAVVRIATAEPKIYRRDIVRRMQELLREGDVALQDEIGKALHTWSEEGDGSEEAVLAAVEKLRAANGKVPESLVKFLVEREVPAVIPIVDEFWASNANAWEELYGRLGPAIEDSVLARYGDAKITLKMSATRLLGKVGTAKSIPVLEASRSEAIPELKMLIDRALDALRARQ